MAEGKPCYQAPQPRFPTAFEESNVLPIEKAVGSIFFFGRGRLVVTFTFMRFALKPARRKIRIIPLIAATCFMVSGGPYGIEDILGGAGFAKAILILVLLPFLWSLPTTLMIGE